MRRLGTGIGWRPEIAEDIARLPGIDWVEVVAENICPGHLPDALRQLRERGTTVVPHGVSLGLGGAEPPDRERLAALAERAEALGAPLVTEHIAFVRAGGPLTASPRIEAGHLLPVPRTREALDVLCANVRIAQDALPVPLALENIAALISWPGEELTEGQFLTELVERTGVRLLIDVANLHTNHVNRGEDPVAALDALPLSALAYVHVAGGVERDGVWHDSHAHPVPRSVLDVLAELCARTTPSGVLLERDEDFPAFEELAAELDEIRSVTERAALTAAVRAAWTAAEAGAVGAGSAADGVAHAGAAGTGAGEAEAAGTGAAEAGAARAGAALPDAPEGRTRSAVAVATRADRTAVAIPRQPRRAHEAVPAAATAVAEAAAHRTAVGRPEPYDPADETADGDEGGGGVAGSGVAVASAEAPPGTADVIADRNADVITVETADVIADGTGADAARARLALAQTALLSALVAGTPAPEGFDRRRLRVQHRALVVKRAGVVAKVAPELPRILGDGFRSAFLRYAGTHPMTGGYRRDALAFTEHLLATGGPRGPLDPAVRRQLAEWWRERSGPAPLSSGRVARLARAARLALRGRRAA
ncbi:DUF692 domain-containing protein [Streptomyces sp. P1-3]|uniref:DUF692 domain-containing protein n=1 Tax=Streptomyces sp. P1-3 TaxID=3421658 RepID=UPI003D35BAA3